MSTPLSDGLYGSDPLLGVADAAREKALARVEALHEPWTWKGRRECQEDGQPWPCRTRRAIDGETDQ